MLAKIFDGIKNTSIDDIRFEQIISSSKATVFELVNSLICVELSIQQSKGSTASIKSEAEKGNHCLTPRCSTIFLKRYPLISIIAFVSL